MNFVVVRDGRTAVRHDRWGALGLPSSLLRGPATARVDDDDLDDWSDKPRYDEAWSEGGVLADFDKRLLCFYSDINLIDDSVGLRRALLPLLAAYWPGWQVRYANRGLADILEGGHLDATGMCQARTVKAVPPDVLHQRLRDVVTVFSHTMTLTEYIEEVDPFASLGPFEGYGMAVLTVRDSTGTVQDHVGSFHVDDALASGPDLLTTLDGALTAEMPNEQIVGDGAWIDVPARSIALWRARSGQLDLPTLSAAWPGWRVEQHDGGLPVHVDMSGRDGAAVRLPPEVVLAEACVSLLQHRSETDARQLYEAVLADGPEWTGGRRVSDAEADVLRRLAAACRG